MKMWALKDNIGREIQLEPDKIITVGRRNAVIVLENDNSISKLHAKITVLKSDDPNLENELICTVMDAGSKYGSFIIGKKNELTRIPAVGHRCKPMEKVRFGLQQHEFTFIYTPSYKYLSLVSRIYGEEREELSSIFEGLNGVLCDEWNPQCTHVTCPIVKLTEKVACALVAGLHIVTKEYWYALVEALNNRKNKRLPNPANFTPKVDSSILVTDKMSLLPNPARKLLFNEKIFIFFNPDQHRLFGRMIELAGGTSIIYDESWKPQDCCENNAVVVQSVDSSQSTQSSTFEYRSVCLRLSQQKLRTIPESEIPLAILYCSTKQHCNPRFNFDILFQPSESNTMVETPGDILTLETQEPRLKVQKKNQRSRIIPESVPVDSQISSQMQAKMSLKIPKQTNVATSNLKINRQNVIIPETASMDTTISSRTQSQISSKTASQNSIASQKQPPKNSKKNVGKPRVMEMETVIPPVFSRRLVRDEPKSDKDGGKMPGPTRQIDVLIDDGDDDDDESNSELPDKTQPRCDNKSSSNTTTKKRSIEIVSPVLPDSDDTNNRNTLAKRRKLNRNVDDDELQPPDEETIEPVPKETNHVGNGKNSASSRDDPSNSDTNVERVPHYFSRNSFDKPKCIIPKRLTINDMYEWKPNRQL